MCAVFAVLLLLALASDVSAATPVFSRPANQDCLASNDSRVLLSDSTALFPQQYYLQGGQTQNISDTVQVKLIRGLEPLSA